MDDQLRYTISVKRRPSGAFFIHLLVSITCEVHLRRVCRGFGVVPHKREIGRSDDLDHSLNGSVVGIDGVVVNNCCSRYQSPGSF